MGKKCVASEGIRTHRLFQYRGNLKFRSWD